MAKIALFCEASGSFALVTLCDAGLVLASELLMRLATLCGGVRVMTPRDALHAASGKNAASGSALTARTNCTTKTFLTYAVAPSVPVPPATSAVMRTVDQASHLFLDTPLDLPRGSRFPNAPTTGSRQSTNKASVRCMSDSRLPCYYCSEAGHVYCDCQYCQLGLHCFNPVVR